MKSSPSVSLEQLVGLNDEIEALVRAGIPLELGLRDSDGSVSNGTARITRRLCERMQGGASLTESLDQEGDHIPGVYRAVVEAGVKSGRLPDALEMVSSIGRMVLDLNRSVVNALIYPLIVAGIAWAMLVGIAVYVVPQFLLTWQRLNLPQNYVTAGFHWMNSNVSLWSVIPPVMVLGTMWLYSWLSQSNLRSPGGRLLSRSLFRLGWFPWVVSNVSLATWCRLLAMLVEHQTPLHNAVLLAAFATGDRRIIASSSTAAARLREGESLEASLRGCAGIPGFLRWMLVVGERTQTLIPSLMMAADVYRSRAVRQAGWLRVMAPVVATVFVGGLVTLIYSLTLFLPISAMYSGMANPTY